MRFRAWTGRWPRGERRSLEGEAGTRDVLEERHRVEVREGLASARGRGEEEEEEGGGGGAAPPSPSPPPSEPPHLKHAH